MTSRKCQFGGAKVKLGDVLIQTFSGEWGSEECDHLTPVLRTSNFNDDGTFDYASPAWRCIPEKKVVSKRLYRGDIVLEKSGGTPKRPVGIMSYYDSDQLALCSNFNQVLRVNSELMHPKYAFFQLRWLKQHNAFERYTRKTTGLQNIQMKKFVNLMILCPEISIQQEVVEQLEAISRQIKNIEYISSRLETLVKSRYTELFGDPVYSVKYPSITLEEACTKLGSGATPKGGKTAYKEIGTPLIRSMNVHNGEFVLKDLAYIDDDQANKLKGVTLEQGDVLLNITGASVARSCMLPDELVGGRVNQHVAIIRPKRRKLLSCVLNATLINDSYQRLLLAGSSAAGATREALTKEDLKCMRVPLPPLKLQQEFADFVACTDKLRQAA